MSHLPKCPVGGCHYESLRDLQRATQVVAKAGGEGIVILDYF